MINVYTLAELAQHLGGTLYGDAKQPIQGVASLSCALNTDLAYFNNPVFLESLMTTRAGGVLIAENHLSHCNVNAIVVANPFSSMNIVATMFLPKIYHEPRIHPSAIISSSAKIGRQVVIGENTVLGDEVVLNDNVVLGANCVLEAHVEVGANTTIRNGVRLHASTRLGNSVVVESGAVIGATPFNSIKQQGHWHYGPAVGAVIIADDVYIGANTVIARGALSDTFIDKGVHIDNLVMIAHDVIIGANSAIAGCAVIGAYAQIGAHCIVGGASCIAPDVRLVDDVVITGMSTVNKSIMKAGIYSSGTMVCEHHQWRRNAARFRRLDDYIARLVNMEKKIALETDSFEK